VFFLALRGRDDDRADVEAFFPQREDGQRHLRRVQKRVALLYAILAFACHGESSAGDWTGNYAFCERHNELLKREPMDLGVRFSTSDRRVALQFARAMEFWSAIIDMRWYEENSERCALQVVDGQAPLFRPAQVARAQFPGAPSFQGWIAFNPTALLSSSDLFVTAVHELGHALGLQHSRDPNSVMYFLRLEGDVFVGPEDLAVLKSRHKLRNDLGTSIPVVGPTVLTEDNLTTRLKPGRRRPKPLKGFLQTGVSELGAREPDYVLILPSDRR
jgi:hypothetical protein